MTNEVALRTDVTLRSSVQFTALAASSAALHPAMHGARVLAQNFHELSTQARMVLEHEHQARMDQVSANYRPRLLLAPLLSASLLPAIMRRSRFLQRRILRTRRAFDALGPVWTTGARRRLGLGGWQGEEKCAEQNHLHFEPWDA